MSAPGSLGLAGLLALGEDGNTNGLAGAVGQGDGTADVLVGLTSIDAQTEVGLDGLVELGGVELLDELGSLKGGVERGAVDLLGSGVIALTMLSHVHYLLWLNGASPPTSYRVPYCTHLTGAPVGAPVVTKRNRYSAMVTPMERAVPAMIFLAASMSLALRSGILISAILVSCSWES